MAGELAEVCADNLRRGGDTVSCRGVVHNATVMATDVMYDASAGLAVFVTVGS